MYKYMNGRVHHYLYVREVKLASDGATEMIPALVLMLASYLYCL